MALPVKWLSNIRYPYETRFLLCTYTRYLSCRRWYVSPKRGEYTQQREHLFLVNVGNRYVGWELPSVYKDQKLWRESKYTCVINMDTDYLNSTMSIGRQKKKRVTGLWIVFYSPITWYHHPGDHTGLPCHFSFNQPIITPKIHDVETS